MDNNNNIFDSSAPIGKPRRVRHYECTPNDAVPAMNITRMNDGWVWYCFRCRKGGKKFLNSLSPKEFHKWMKYKDNQKSEIKTTEVTLPHDFTSNLSPQGKVWFYKYGVCDDEIKQYGIGYSPYMDRVILPVYRDSKLLFWIGRNVGGITKTNPKYSTVSGYKRKDIYFITGRFDNSVCIVEDVISGIKVGRYMKCYTLISAHVPDRMIKNILDKYGNGITIYLWLDPDKIDKMIKWQQRYRSLFGADVRMIRADKDPKEFSNAMIRRFLK